MAEAIAEAATKGNMHEMEGNVMTTTEQEIRTPKVDGYQVSPNLGNERESTNVEGTGARPTRADEIWRGKQPMTQSQQERDIRPRQRQTVDILRLGGVAAKSSKGPAPNANTTTAPGEQTANVDTGRAPASSPRHDPGRTPAVARTTETANTLWGLWSATQCGKA
jgi:hypothetical protein